MDEKTMTPKHRDVVVKLRERLEQYRRRHSDCQSKQERSLAVIEDQERQEALVLHKRVLESRNTKLLNKIKQQEIAKIEHPSNGLELKSTNAILQNIILKRKHDQGLNNLHMNCDGENGPIGESLSKYSRTDDINNPGLSASSHEHQISMQQSADQQQSNPGSQSDSMNNPKSTTLVGNNGHFVGDTSRSSPLLAPSGTHTSEAFQNANRVSSPNSLPPTEFKQDSSHSVAVTSDGGRANGITLNNSTRTSTETKTADSVAGQELQEQLNDFERVLMSITNSDIYKNTAMNADISTQHHQISTRQTPSQIDSVSRDSLNPQQQQQSPSVQNPSTAQQNPYPTPPAPPGPTALHLQQLARQAQSQRAQANPAFMDSQEQESNQRFRPQQMQFMDAIRFAVSGSQQQLQSQTSMQPAQFSASNRFHAAMATSSDQYGNMYSTKDQNHNVIMSTGFPSNSTMSLQYQRMMQTQAVQQQALYSRVGQQAMRQRLSHQSFPEHQQSSYPPYQPPQNMPHSQYNGMPMQNLPAYSSSGFQNIRSNQTQFSRQLSMPTPQGYQEQYPINQYQMGDQQVPNQQQTDLSASSYHNYNRRNSFPLYHRSVNQPVANYGPAGPHPGGPHAGYQPSVNQMRNNISAPNSASAAMIDSRNNPQSAGYNYNNQTSFASQSGLQGMMQLPQRNGPAMSQAATMQPRTDQQNIQGYAAAASNMRDAPNSANLSQEMKYSTRNDIPKNTRAPTFSDPLSLTDPTSTSSDSHYNPFSPLGSLEKAPSFASLLEQSSGPLNNLETTYTGSIPNLDLLGEIIG